MPRATRSSLSAFAERIGNQGNLSHPSKHNTTPPSSQPRPRFPSSHKPGWQAPAPPLRSIFVNFGGYPPGSPFNLGLLCISTGRAKTKLWSELAAGGPASPRDDNGTGMRSRLRLECWLGETRNNDGAETGQCGVHTSWRLQTLFDEGGGGW